MVTSEEKKECTICHQTKSLDEYNNSSKLVDGTRKYWKKNFCKVCQSAKFKAYHYSRNPDARKEVDKRYYENNKVKITQTKKLYLQNDTNREKHNSTHRKYVANKKKNDVNFRLMTIIRARIHASFKNKSNSSIEYLGCDIQSYVNWIEFTMEPDMTWENYGVLWNIDHVKPIASFDATNNEEMIKAFNWKNTCARYSAENFSKGKKICENAFKNQDELLKLFMSKHTHETQNISMDNPQPSTI